MGPIRPRQWIGLVALAWVLWCTAAVAAPAQRTVLYLVAEAPGNAYYAALYRGFRDRLEHELPNQVQVFMENLELPQFDGPDYRRELTRWLRYKYQDVHLDAVVVAGTPALRYLTDARLWDGVPTYLLSANDDVVRRLILPPHMTGQSVELSMAGTLDLIGRLFPDARTVALVANPAGQDTYRPNIEDELALLRRRYTLLDLRGQPVEQVHAILGRLPADAVVYHQTYTLDGSGRRFDPYAALNVALHHANRPVFVDYTTFVGSGAVGGVAIDAVALGSHGAAGVATLLRGTPPAALPFARRTFDPVVDARALGRWDVDRRRLPPGTIVIHDQLRDWERYRSQILGAAALILTLTLLILALLVERRRRERAVAESRQRLAELAHLNRGVTATVYAGAIAHDLNQPLAAIMSNTEATELFLAADPPQLAAAREALADIKRDDRRASDIIRSMRGMLKRSTGAAEIIDLRQVVADAVTFIAPEIRLRQGTVRTVLDEQPLPVRGDPVQLQQVLINLVLNAMDAMADMAPPERVVEIRAGRHDAGGDCTRIKVRVADRGPGFAGDVRTVFDSFITTKQHGTGLGLPITAAIVREHGGQIRARNLVPFGAQISFTLPCAGACAAPKEPADG